MKQKELAAILGGILGYTPKRPELARALARDGEDELPRGTFYEWLKSGADRDTDSLRRVAVYYAGHPDKDGNPIDPVELRELLEAEYGYSVGGGGPGFTQTATRKKGRAKRPLPDTTDLG